MELAELIEKHIEYVDEARRTVRLPHEFVKHYLRRDDGGEGLPIVSSISQLPIVLPNGEILSGRGLDRRYGIIFRGAGRARRADLTTRGLLAAKGRPSHALPDR